MKMRIPGRTTISGVIILGLLLVSCAADEAAIATTVQAQIPLALTVTAEAEPTVTPYSTHTPYPVSAVYPTATPYATHTPYPTEEPYPTATPYPTFTLANEEGSVTEVTIVTTNVVAATTTSPTGQPTTVTGDFAATLLQIHIDLHGEMLRFISTIDAALRNRSPALHCANLVQHYDTIMAYPTFDVGNVDLTLQNIYGNYRAAIERINGVGAVSSAASNGAIDLIEGCRAFLNNNTQGDLAVIRLNQARLSVDAAAAIVSQNIRLLGGE